MNNQIDNIEQQIKDVQALIVEAQQDPALTDGLRKHRIDRLQRELFNYSHDLDSNIRAMQNAHKREERLHVLRQQ